MSTFKVIDGFLSFPELQYWASQEHYTHERIMNERYEKRENGNWLEHYDAMFLLKCKEIVLDMFPTNILELSTPWPRIAELRIGQEMQEHTDPGMVSCVYHAALSWDKDGGGELKIGDNTIDYVPNRLVVFDANPPHSVLAPKNRVRKSVVIAFKIL